MSMQGRGAGGKGKEPRAARPAAAEKGGGAGRGAEPGGPGVGDARHAGHGAGGGEARGRAGAQRFRLEVPGVRQVYAPPSYPY
jgi:hypothetical protein